MSKVCGKLHNDGTDWLAWSYSVTLDGEYIDGRKYFETKFFAKLAMKRAVRRAAKGKSGSYTYCKPYKPAQPKETIGENDG